MAGEETRAWVQRRLVPAAMESELLARANNLNNNNNNNRKMMKDLKDIIYVKDR